MALMEMMCVVCNKTIQRGHRFVGSKYKNLKFCCEECYNQYCSSKKKKTKNTNEKYLGWKKLIAYINTIYPDNYLNWPMITKQIKSIMEEYNIDCDTIRKTIRYAIEYEQYRLNPEWGLGQFFPRFLQPMLNFVERIKLNKSKAQNLKEINYVEIKNHGKKIRYNRRIEDFD